MNICWLAGETSGDLHAARVVEVLRKRLGDCQQWGMAGPAMIEAGCEVVVDQREMAVMGFAEVIKHLPTIRRNMENLLTEVKNRRPDVVVFVDYPGFNLRFAKQLLSQYGRGAKPRRLGYISPQVWAWKAGRIPQIAERYDGLAVVFPFELDTYRDVALDVRLVGHPLLEEILPAPDRIATRAKYRLGDGPVVALLPGSRKQELLRHAQVLADAFVLLKQRVPNVRAVVPTVSTLPNFLYDTLQHAGAELIADDASAVIACADAAAVASGTATLQTALLGTPQVVLYRTSPVSFAIGKRVVKVPYIALANLAMGEKIAPERLQNEATGQQLCDDLQSLLGEEGALQRRRFAGLVDRLGGGSASERVADWIVEMAGRA